MPSAPLSSHQVKPSFYLTSTAWKLTFTTQFLMELWRWGWMKELLFAGKETSILTPTQVLHRSIIFPCRKELQEMKNAAKPFYLGSVRKERKRNTLRENAGVFENGRSPRVWRCTLSSSTASWDSLLCCYVFAVYFLHSDWEISFVLYLVHYFILLLCFSSTF